MKTSEKQIVNDSKVKNKSLHVLKKHFTIFEK